MTPLEMIAEWRRGCSNTIVMGEPPENCPECARDLVDALERALRAAPVFVPLSDDAQKMVRELMDLGASAKRAGFDADSFDEGPW